ncbi:UPF0058 family protein [Haloarchaeobius amylolyticus]|uniref:UPF0058 family protein n=1 Tax=Haloarchaeobius amylolyticus TaxID=1198296 RepID=UPI00226D9CD7|nr:UPF0058 family protein [Haloarchaeobius amylolyticus]
MRKQELLHLHQLLSQIRSVVETDEPVPPGAFTPYDEFGVGPYSFNRQKADHEEAIYRLMAGIVATIEASEAETAEPVDEMTP